MIAGSYDKYMFSFVRNSQTAFQHDCTIVSFPSAINESSCHYKASPAFGVGSVSDFGHSEGCVVVESFFDWKVFRFFHYFELLGTLELRVHQYTTNKPKCYLVPGRTLRILPVLSH